MMIRMLIVIITSLLFVSTIPRAEANTCPPGYYPIGGGTGGWTGCAPIPNGNTQSPPDPGPQWASRWGAIYVQPERGAFGISENMPSKGKARKAAEKDCIARGGRKCRMIIESRNQCSALAGNELSTIGSRRSTKEEAESAALAECLRDSGRECALVYSGCSYPVRIR